MVHSMHGGSYSNCFHMFTLSDNFYGQCGQGDTGGEYALPISKVIASNGSELADQTVVSIYTGRYHSIALTATGQLIGWGYGGALTFSGSNNYHTPILLNTSNIDSPIKLFAVGGTFNLIVSQKSTVYFWGEVGSGSGQEIPTAVDISALDGAEITDVAAGGYHAVILVSNGLVYTWGSNK